MSMINLTDVRKMLKMFNLPNNYHKNIKLTIEFTATKTLYIKLFDDIYKTLAHRKTTKMYVPIVKYIKGTVYEKVITLMRQT